MTIRPNLLVIRVSDLGASRSFYEALGLEFRVEKHGSGPEHLSYGKDGFVFEVYQRRSETDSTSAVRIGFSVPSLDPILSKLDEIRAEIVSKPKGSQWGRRAVFRDPDGHAVELSEQSEAVRVTPRRPTTLHARFMVTVLLGSLLVAGCSSPEPDRSEALRPVENQAAKIGKRINIEFDEVALSVAMQQISEKVGYEIRVDPEVEEFVSVSLRDILWREAVAVIAIMSRCEVVEGDGALLLQRHATVMIQFSDADVRVVLKLLAAYQGKTIQLPDDLAGVVDVDLVVSESAIQMVLDQVGGYRVVQEAGDLLRVVAQESGE